MKYDKGTVHRIYLEYCNTDVDGLIDDAIRFVGLCLSLFSLDTNDNRAHRPTFGHEVEMWGIFHCLAKAIYAMASGNEDIEADRWEKDIVHMDLKFGNGKWDVRFQASAMSPAN